MRKYLIGGMLAWLLASGAAAGVFEPWSVLDSANIGTYQDTNGSIIMFLTAEGPKAGERALKIESTLKDGGYCGIWHNIAADLSRAGAVKFMAKSSKPGEVQLSLKDKYNIQYIAFVQIPSSEWTEVTANLSAFTKDPYYTPPDAIPGHAMDVSETKGFNFGPKMVGDASILIGPLYTGDASKGAAKPAAAKPAAVKPAVSKPAAKASAKAASAKKTAGKIGGVLEPWTSMDGSNAGTYADTTGSVASFSITAGPRKGEKALLILSDMKEGGWCGLWHNLTGDLSKASALKFQAKSSKVQDVQIAIKDNHNVQYVSRFTAPAAWGWVEVPLTSFIKDPYYTPPDADLGHPLDPSVVKGLNFAPSATGATTLVIGPVGWVEGEFTPAAVSAEPEAGPAEDEEGAAPAEPTGEHVVLQEFTVDEGGIGGTYADTTGSKCEYTLGDAKKKRKDAKKGDKVLSASYKLVSGGWCGIWYRAGDTWDGVNGSNAVAIEMTVYTPKPMILGMALKDNTDNQYIADGPMTKGGKWETVTIPISSFVKDPYYTPPEAIVGAAQDLSKIKTFNIVPKTEGEGSFEVDKIEVVK